MVVLPLRLTSLTLLWLFVFGLCPLAQAQTAAVTPGADKATPLPIPGFSALLHSVIASSMPGPTSKITELLQASDSAAATKQADMMDEPTNYTKEPHLVWAAKALPLIALKKNKEAEALLQKAIKLRSTDSDVLLLKAFSELGQEKWSVAINTLDEAQWFSRYRAFDPGWAPYLSALATSHLPSATGTEVGALLAKAAGASATFWPAREAQARMEIEKGNRQAAIVLLRQVVSLQPNAGPPKILLAQALLLNSDRVLNASLIAEASSLTTSVVDDKTLSPEDAVRARATHVRALLASDKTREAAKSLNKGLKDFPSDGTLLALRDQVQLEKSASTETGKNS